MRRLSTDGTGDGDGNYNAALWADMGTICRNVYPGADPRRAGCETFRDTYCGVVTATHLNNI